MFQGWATCQELNTRMNINTRYSPIHPWNHIYPCKQKSVSGHGESQVRGLLQKKKDKNCWNIANWNMKHWEGKQGRKRLDAPLSSFMINDPSRSRRRNDYRFVWTCTIINCVPSNIIYIDMQQRERILIFYAPITSIKMHLLQCQSPS